VETLCLFRHPHIVAVLDWDKTADGRWYAVMEFLAGKTLLQHIHERTKLTTEQVIEIVLQIGGALGLAHASGVVHGAIVPANVFLLADCEHVCVKLFGFAAEAQSRASMTSDQYSLATILYELLTKRPLTGAPSKRGLPQELSAVVLRALSRDQKDRYRSVQSFCAALRHAVGLVRPNSALVGLAAGDERPHFELPAAGLSLARTSAPTQPGGDWGRRAAKSLEADIELARREAKSRRRSAGFCGKRDRKGREQPKPPVGADLGP
jgi:serine/threonine protein kinase